MSVCEKSWIGRSFWWDWQATGFGGRFDCPTIHHEDVEWCLKAPGLMNHPKVQYIESSKELKRLCSHDYHLQIFGFFINFILNNRIIQYKNCLYLCFNQNKWKNKTKTSPAWICGCPRDSPRRAIMKSLSLTLLGSNISYIPSSCTFESMTFFFL